MSEYERWETRFSAPGYLFGTWPNAFLKSKADLLKAKQGGKALSVADGEGRNGVFMAECGLDVLSIDFSPTAQAKARKLAKDRGVTLRVEQADLTAWTWPAEAFDVVAGIFLQFLSPAERSAVFAGIARALKPGGLLLIERYGPKQLEYKTGGPHSSRTFTPARCWKNLSRGSRRLRSKNTMRRSTKVPAMAACPRWSIWSDESRRSVR